MNENSGTQMIRKQFIENPKKKEKRKSKNYFTNC